MHNKIINRFVALHIMMSVILVGSLWAAPSIPNGFDISQLSPDQQTMANEYIKDKKNKKDTKKAETDTSIPSKNESTKKDTAIDSTIERLYLDKDPFNLYTIPELYQPGMSLDETKVNQLSSPLDKARSLGAKLKKQTIKQFGYSIFDNQQDTELNIPVSDDYILGPGDHLVIHLWGKVSNTFDVEIDNTGKIFIPQIGPLILSGVQYKNVKHLIKKAFNTKYTNFDISVTMGELKSIKVFILGEASRPGAYDISSLSTLFTALVQAGGPTHTGSLRNIKLKRNKRTIKTVDLYSYLIRGDNSQDPKLKAYDTIFIPPIKGVIKVSGMVKRPGIFELKRETTAYDVLYNLAGGFWAASYQQSIRIERIVGGKKRVLMTLNTHKPKATIQKLKKTKIQDGDFIHIIPILDQKFNLVTIQGEIYRPGSYELRPNMTLQDLIDEAEGRLPSAIDTIELFRFVSKSQRELISLDLAKETDRLMALKEYDYINILSEPQHNVYIFGSIIKPGQYMKLHNMTVSDLLEMASPQPFAQLEHLELARKNEDGTTIMALNGYDVLFNPETTQNLVLQHDDQVFVRSNKELELSHSITLTGAVRFPGTYRIRMGETMSDVFERAGGITSEGDLAATTLIRSSIEAREKTEQELILEKERKRVLYDRSQYGRQDIQPSELLASLDTLLRRKMGRVQLDVNNGNGIIVLDDQDRINVPKIANTVSLFGGVMNPTAIQYDAQHSPDDYIRAAGGFSEFANRGRIYVFKKNGAVDLNGHKVEAGDAIFVAERFELPNRVLETFTSWTQIIVNSATAYALLQSFLK